MNSLKNLEQNFKKEEIKESDKKILNSKKDQMKDLIKNDSISTTIPEEYEDEEEDEENNNKNNPTFELSTNNLKNNKNNSFSLNKHSLSFMNNKWIFQNKENFNEKLT